MSTDRLRTEKRRDRILAWIGVGLIALFVGLLGGSSRFDVPQVAALRPIAALTLIPILMTLRRRDLGGQGSPLLLLLALGGLMALQLVPLPPDLWQALPRREMIAALDRAVGFGDLWRPISLTPTRTLNALASLVVPIVALLAFCALRTERRNILYVVIALGLMSGVIGLLQLVGEQTNMLYFYRVTASGQAVGLMANNNHAGVLSALTMLAIAHLASEPRYGMTSPGKRFVLGGIFVLAFVCGLSSSSRAGTLGTTFALLAGAIIFYFGLTQSPRARAMDWAKLRRNTLSALVAIGVGTVLGAYLLWDRLAVVDRFGGESMIEDLRYRLFPVLWQMTETFWLAGAGFGSFEDVYHIFEPTALLTPKYVNQAHNDWMQWVIEGGVPAVLILLAAALWTVRQARALARQGNTGFFRLLFWGSAFALLAFASLVDYPLRTPLFQVVAVWLFALFADEAQPWRRQSPSVNRE